MDNIEKALDNFFQRLGHTPGPWKSTKDEETTFHEWFVELEQEQHHPIAEMIDFEANAKLIAQSPAMLRTLCRTYLWMLTNLSNRGHVTYGETIRVFAQETLADLRNQISNATGIEDREVQESFEQYALWIQTADINLHPDFYRRTKRPEPADQRDPEEKIWSAMQEGAEDYDDRP